MYKGVDAMTGDASFAGESMHILTTSISYFELVAFRVNLFSMPGLDWERGHWPVPGLNTAVGSKLVLGMSRSH